MFLNVPLLGIVALRKESVDRNRVSETLVPRQYQSLSARRAWIEIYNYIIRLNRRIVALRKESVDRNTAFCVDYPKNTCRSPQGERG